MQDSRDSCGTPESYVYSYAIRSSFPASEYDITTKIMTDHVKGACENHDKNASYA
jgi:hypothetical protein